MAGRALAEVADEQLRRLRRAEDVERVGQKRRALLRKRDLAAAAREKRHAETVLELADLAADGRLRDAELARRLAEVENVGQRDKAAELGYLHAGRLLAPHFTDL